jgi:hypothetical protein
LDTSSSEVVETENFIRFLPLNFLPGKEFRRREVWRSRQGVTENVPFSFVVSDSVVQLGQSIHPSDLSFGKLGLSFQVLKRVVITADSESRTM